MEHDEAQLANRYVTVLHMVAIIVFLLVLFIGPIIAAKQTDNCNWLWIWSVFIVFLA